ncbi:MAG: hypothetical protein LBH43_20695 [Treponema sp.]|jgi:hypothetical protein|nr:hypothetical protein [Treponema sp.]
MQNGKITGNTVSSTNGVYVAVAGNFNMNGGEISGNTGQGVYISANGIIYGSNEADTGLRNGNGALTNSGTAQYGVFSGSTWDSGGAVYSTAHTIKIVNGVPYIGSLLAHNSTFDVGDASEWENAREAINTYNDFSYTINVTADFDIAGRTATNFIRTGIKVTLQGEGRTLGLSSN